MNEVEKVLQNPGWWRDALFDGLTMNEGGPADVDYSGLPESLRYGMQAYIEKGYVPGHFLAAVLENDLKEAVHRSDAANLILLPRIVTWLYFQAPLISHGSPERVSTWAEGGGSEGLKEDQDA